MLRRAQTEPTALELYLDNQASSFSMTARSDSSPVFGTPRQNALMLHNSFGTPAPAHACARHDAYAYAYGHATPSNGYALPQSNSGYVTPIGIMESSIDAASSHAAFPPMTPTSTYATPMHAFATPAHAFSAPPSEFSTPPPEFQIQPRGFATPPPPGAYPQLYPQFDMQQQYRPLLMGTHNGLEQPSQAQFLTGFEPDLTYTHAAFMSSFPLPIQAQDGSSLYHPGSFNAYMDAQPLAPSQSHGAQFLLPPPPQMTENDSFASAYSASPSWSDNGLPSPHQLGQLFSENFEYGQAHMTPPTHTSPLMLNERLYSSPPPLLHDLPGNHYNHVPLPQPPLSVTVDFETLQRGTITPALSDISDAPSSTTLLTPPSLFSDTPLSNGFGDAFAFESEGEGEEMDGNLALFGGLGLDVSDDFNIAASAHSHHIRDIGSSGNVGASGVGNTGEAAARGDGRESDRGRVRGSAPTGERDENDDAEQTPYGSPRQIELALPPARDAEQVLGSGPSAAGEEVGQVHLPPTPRLSPLPPSFL